MYIGEASDTGSFRYVVSVSSMANSDAPLSISYSNPINIDIVADASGVSFDVEASTFAVPLTGWASTLTAGAPFSISVCRDGDDGADTSTVNSYLRKFKIRIGKTNP